MAHCCMLHSDGSLLYDGQVILASEILHELHMPFWEEGKGKEGSISDNMCRIATAGIFLCLHT